MTSQNEQVEIDVTELAAHQHHLADVVIRVGNAHEAAGVPLNPDVFGAFGRSLARNCAESMAEGEETLRTAHEAVREHHRKVGIWVQDVDATEADIANLFRAVPVMRDA
jgi:hypothetical protein